jgi:YgiT-type zinc finger domain-containing protein
MRCPLCKGEMKEGKTILPYELGKEQVIVLLDVPALICEQCGDEFVDINVTRNIEKILDKVKSDGMRMGFVEYRKAA